ncbi:MAG: DegT/DnrJ/EryC1/StrS family aminotransferase [Bifidobacteriaceae bacterium]|jgi:CDP-6-deoxy-D-xylo-4-hexulose-3-dehydrase|nr:DegT/DnrJ/EryC1/StrS family aminotransferase [Bifidobacteriaceae bacterium]
MTNDPTPAAYPLATPSWDEKEKSAIKRVVDSGRFTMGPEVARYEAAFARQFGARHAVMVNSGSSANLLAVAAAVIDPRFDLAAGDEVIVPAVSWATTYYPLSQYGLTPRFVDIDPETLNLDIDQVAAAIGPKTKAVFAVNLLGNPVDYERLCPLAEDAGLIVLEDNCESMGATLGGKHTGTFGLMGTFSSFFSHHISTMEGGVIATDDDQLDQELRSLRSHGWTRGLPDDNYVYPKTGDDFEDLFRFVLPGYNVRPLELEGAIGTEQLAKLPGFIAQRRQNARHFQDAFAGLADVRLQRETGTSSWFGFAMVFTGRLAGRRRDVVAALKTAGIESRPIVAGNFARNPVMQYLKAVVPQDLPAADQIHRDGLFVGNDHRDLTVQIDRLAELIGAL